MRLLLIALALLAVAPAYATPLDVCISITGTKAQARVALQTLGFEKEMLQDGQIVGYNHHVAIDLWMKPILQFPVHDANGNEITPPVFAPRPILRIRFLKAEIKAKAKAKIINVGGLPVGLTKVSCPATRKWFGD